MNRDNMLSQLQDKSTTWDFIIIGGGATGVGIAIDAASRGYKVLLLEQHDFAKGTSSRSTKLVHGGVRYLQQGNLSLVLEALRERGLLLKNAPHIVSNLPFIVPNYEWWESPFYGIGLKLYDALAGKLGFGPSKLLSKEKTTELIPTIEQEGLIGGVIYHDGQFDDARLVINMAQTAAEQGGTLLNYVKVTAVTKSDGYINGVVAYDVENDVEYELKTRAVINATGAFSDAVRRMDDDTARQMIIPSQGVHIVLDKSFLPGETAIMVPHTADGRVLFAIPWHNRVIVGTTDTPIKEVSLEPRPMQEELDFLLEHAAKYLTKDPTPADVLSAFAGIRPLVAEGEAANTAAISRDHTVHISGSGLITIAGGKWTTYRKMAEDTLDQAIQIARLDYKPSVTYNLQIHGYHMNTEKFGVLKPYGSDAPAIENLIREKSEYTQPLHPNLRPLTGEVIWAVRHEMACTPEDFLARRTRSLLLDARASREIVDTVAKLMAKELGRDKKWIKNGISSYNNLADTYIID
ncbi:FAD-dependent oxidoreductase [Calditrichota bacterium]